METTLKKILLTVLLLSAAIPSGVQAMSPEDIADQVADVAAQVLSENTPGELIQAALAKVAATVVAAPIAVLEKGMTTVMTAVMTEEAGEMLGAEVAQVGHAALGQAAKSVGNKVGALLAIIVAPLTVAAISKLRG